MPNLPTVAVTQPQADRIQAAFGSVAAYTQWLKDQVKQYVLAKELQAVYAQRDQDIQAKQDDINANLGL